MKKTLISIVLTASLLTSVFSQADKRTRVTKIADMVMKLPVENTAGFNQMMDELSRLGDVVVDLAPQLTDPGGNDAQIRYANLAAYQYHGSVYGLIPVKRGFLKPAGEWNVQEVLVDGHHIKVTLNGTVILDGNIAEASNNSHPMLSTKRGHIAFLGHDSNLAFRNLRIKDLSK